MFKSIRFKLVLWYFIVLSIILVTFSILLFVSYRYSLYSKVDGSLQSRAEAVASLIDIQNPGVIRQFKFSGNSKHMNLDQIGINFPANPSLAPFIDQARIYGQFIQILDINGNVIEKSSNLGSVAFYLQEEDLRKAKNGISFIKTLKIEKKFPIRLLTYPVKNRNNKVLYIIQVGGLLNELENSLEKLSFGLLLTIPTTILLSLLGGFIMAGRALKPIEIINLTAEKINAENLAQRLTINNPEDEIGRLQKTLNRMFDRLENAFNIQKRFTADASHELRTPLTILKGEIELALKRERPVEEYKEGPSSSLEEVDRLTKIVKDLLLLARADEGKNSNIKRQKVDIVGLCKETIKQIEKLAEEKKISIETDFKNPILIEADEDRIKQLIFNLLENGIKYNKDCGKLKISIRETDKNIILNISDTGIGISQEDLNHIFERFYRVDKARSRELGGSGLGLSIVKWITEFHNGKINVESKDGEGTTFTITLPKLK